MRRPSCRSQFAACLVILALGCLPYDVYEAKSASIKDEISQERQRLEQLNKEIQDTQKKARQVGKKHGSILKNIEELDRQLFQHKKERKRIDQQIKEKDEELANLSEQIRNLTEEVRAYQDSVAARLRLLYTEGRSGYLKSLFAAESFADMATRIDFISWLARREAQLIREFQENLSNLQSLNEHQAQARGELLTLQEGTKKPFKIFQVSSRPNEPFSLNFHGKRTRMNGPSRTCDSPPSRWIACSKNSTADFNWHRPGCGKPRANLPPRDHFFGLWTGKWYPILVSRNIRTLTLLSIKKASKSRFRREAPSGRPQGERLYTQIGSRDMAW
jgi:peptidoglycan hydrolase CwlO-like protein